MMTQIIWKHFFCVTDVRIIGELIPRQLLCVILRSGRPATEERIGKIQKMAGEGAGKSAAKVRGAGGSAGKGAAPHSIPRKAPLTALPPALLIFAALFPAPSPAISGFSHFSLL